MWTSTFAPVVCGYREDKGKPGGLQFFNALARDASDSAVHVLNNDLVGMDVEGVEDGDEDEDTQGEDVRRTRREGFGVHSLSFPVELHPKLKLDDRKV